jgi:DNA-binding LacI/PurR family transcriptional regulator
MDRKLRIMASIKDVAKLAGVSIATVSNVMNDPMKVKDTTRARVLRAATELNYSNINASATRTPNGKARVIGVITEDITVFNTPEILHAIFESASERGWNVLMTDLGVVRKSSGYSVDELHCAGLARNAVNLLFSQGLDGIIYLACQSREIRHLADGYSLPFVYAYCYSNDNHAPSVVYDDRSAAYELIKHLIDNGHKNIGILSGPESNIHVRDRLLGYQAALFDAGILYNPNIQYRGDWDDPNFAFSSMDKFSKNEITAVFCMNDVMAGGVFDYALSHGIRIPQDLSVVGFDNQSISTALYPKLTTVALPLQEIGREAISQMEKLLYDRSYSIQPNVIKIPCHPIFRDSVAKVK